MVLSSHRTAAVCVLLALLVAVHGVQPAAAAGDRKGRKDSAVRQHNDELAALSSLSGQNVDYGMQTASGGGAFSTSSQDPQAAFPGSISIQLRWQPEPLISPGRQTLQASPPPPGKLNRTGSTVTPTGSTVTPTGTTGPKVTAPGKDAKATDSPAKKEGAGSTAPGTPTGPGVSTSPPPGNIPVSAPANATGAGQEQPALANKQTAGPAAPNATKEGHLQADGSTPPVDASSKPNSTSQAPGNSPGHNPESAPIEDEAPLAASNSDKGKKENKPPPSPSTGPDTTTPPPRNHGAGNSPPAPPPLWPVSETPNTNVAKPVTDVTSLGGAYLNGTQGNDTQVNATQVPLRKGTLVNLSKGLKLKVSMPQRIYAQLQKSPFAAQHLTTVVHRDITPTGKAVIRVDVQHDINATLWADMNATVVRAQDSQLRPNTSVLQLPAGSRLELPTAAFTSDPATNVSGNASSKTAGGRRLLAKALSWNIADLEVELEDNATFYVNATEDVLKGPNPPLVALSAQPGAMSNSSTPGPVTSPSPSPGPVTPPAATGPSPGVIAGAVMGAVGGVALLGLLTSLLVLRRRSKYRNTYAYPITGASPVGTVGTRSGKVVGSASTPGSGKDVLLVGGRDQGLTSTMKARRPAPEGPTVVDVGALMGGTAAARGAMAPGFTGDELHAGLSDLKHIVTNRLLPAVDASPLEADVVAAWLDAGVENVRDVLPVSKGDYTASHSFVEDWRTHRIWNWLNDSFWRFIPTNQQLLAVQAPADVVSLRSCYARYVLGLISRDPSLPPFKSAVDAAVGALMTEAAAQARSSGIGVGGVQAAAGYYRPVLVQLCEVALRFHLQVQGTADSMLVFVPGASKPLAVGVPADGLVCKSRRGGIVPCRLCERPGVLGGRTSNKSGVDVWVPADAVDITPL